jgi:hypothetical protein
MNKIIGLLAILVLALFVSACATANLPDNATPEERRAALCMDAQTGLAMAEAALAGHLSSEERAYWRSFRRGAMIGINTYCLAGKRKSQ